MKAVCFSVFIILLFSSCKVTEQKATKWQLSSPSGNIKLEVIRSASGRLTYQADLSSEKMYRVIEGSRLGIVCRSERFDTLRVISDHRSTQNEEYTMISGKRKVNRNHYNQLLLRCENDFGSTIDIFFRIYDDGIAFRYAFPGSSNDSLTVIRELSSFNLPDSGKAWIQGYDSLATWSPAYEKGYTPGIEISDPSPSSTGWGFPALFSTKDAWILLTESDLDEKYAGSHLAENAPDGEYFIELPHQWESYGLGSAHPSFLRPMQTPWRLILLSNDLAGIVESNLPTHVAEPSRVKDTDWISPGRASWSWWSDHESGRNFDKLKAYVDFSARMGWEFSLVDADWHIMEGGTLEDLVAYADDKGVGLLIWYNSGGPHTRVDNAGPRDLMYDREIRRSEMKRISELGIKGIKVDFFQSDKQDIIQLYLEIAEDAADYKLLLNTHGCSIPRGWHRTFPHFLTMEGVRGAELYGWEGFPPQAVYLNTVYPYTRNIIGPMDYTPVTFFDFRENKHLTTNAHELALSVIFESGIQHIADPYQSIENQPKFVVEFLKHVPANWDDIHFVDGYPGKYTILARRKDDTFYLAGNSSLQQDTIEISTKLDFLAEEIYNVRLITDGDSPRSFAERKFTYQSNEWLTLSIQPRGGFVAILEIK